MNFEVGVDMRRKDRVLWGEKFARIPPRAGL